MRRPKWSTVVIALALVGALAIASPSIGVSLKKLVKKEVAKQIKKAEGPAGPQGAPGADGTARAGARVVGSDASFSPGTAFGGIEATKSAAGGYCIRVPFTPRNIVASVESDDHNARLIKATSSATRDTWNDERECFRDTGERAWARPV